MSDVGSGRTSLFDVLGRVFFGLGRGFSFGSGFLGWVEFWIKIKVKVGSSQDRIGSFITAVPDPCLVSGRVSLFDVSDQVFFRLGRF